MKLRRMSRPQSLDATPMVPIEIPGLVGPLSLLPKPKEEDKFKHDLRFGMAATGRLERELDQDVMDILTYLIRVASGGRFSVRVILAVLAAGIAHEYEKGQEPTWEDIGDQLPTLDSLQPLIAPAMNALRAALVKDTPQPETADPNEQEPAAESTGQDSTVTATTS